MSGGGDRIRLQGLRIVAVHGVLDEERARAQPFEVDVDLHLDLAPAGASDDLSDTVDYGAVVTEVERIVTGESHLLLERLAEGIAAALLRSQPLVDAVTVEVRKLRPPVPSDLVASAVRVTRER